MNILIFYASYGGGHFSAASAVMQYIKKNYPENNVSICDIMKYINKGIDKITTDAYRKVTTYNPKLWGSFYEFIDNPVLFGQNNYMSKVFAPKINSLLKKEDPDLVISCHPIGSQVVAYLKKIHKSDCKLASIMTDFASHSQWLIGSKYIDYIFVSNEPMRQDIISKGIPENKIFTTGIPLSNRFLEHFNKEEIKKSFDLDINKKTILFFGGGEFGLGKDKTIELFKNFVDNLGDKYQMVAISGKNPKMHIAFDNTVNELNAQSKVKVLGFTDKVPELMSISDLVVTKPGGLTTTESLASGLPILVINPIPGQEVQNTLYLEEQGVAKWIKNDIDTKYVIKNILEDDEELQHMKIRSKLIAKRNSTKNICEILLEKKEDES